MAGRLILVGDVNLVNVTDATIPAIIARNGLRVSIVQRSSVYWPTDHEAQANSPGIAVIRGHTAYHVPTGRIAPGVPPPNRPGVPPLIVTWADAAAMTANGPNRRFIATQRYVRS